ncbi:tRNA uridine-5-carboxymethylaminomethyl(34) synthesis GTPase MnmE [Faecalispora anaeroviscerum]|uniref:tRNA uridine-5-carboxymethylaminomethyl(34) synthesis GTPase MnmE n=1 Tax=Faecalispora anaeroviscerum TaxID=2991836 RepID=UPI0024B8B4FA|nr:tRNA uridine-5-carboxymethylaminomethyl(34) synthesis GTPase MnmE [Faecalispora anaeroviscerum]
MEQNASAIAAISTAQAPGGIGVIRISGPGARQIAGRVFLSAKGQKIEKIPGYTALYGWVCRFGSQPAERLDEAVATVFLAPHSYTGEDVVELSCHGGLYLLRRVLESVLAAGASPAGPGEFTRRAFLNGKMDLTQAESVMQLIGAQGSQALRTARAGREGALFHRIQGSREQLLTIAAHLSAWADYPEEDIPQLDEDSLKGSLKSVRDDLTRLLDQFDAGRVLREGVDTVIVGRPNVGKSTLMNLLAGCERSIVTEYAGTTRDIVEDTVLLGGVPLRLADTAGLRETSDPVESIGVDRAKNRLNTAQLVLAVFDSSSPLTAEDKELIAHLTRVPAIAVINKSDLKQKIDIKYIQDSFQQYVYISAKVGDGLAELQQVVEQLLHTADLNPSEGILFTERQRDTARRAKERLEEAMDALCGGLTLDAVTVSVESAVSALLELTGERATNEIVDMVFAHFCVGK